MSATEQFVEDAVLTAVAIAYRNPDQSLIADDVLPRVDAPARSFKYSVYDEAEGFTVPDTKVGRRSTPPRVELEGSEQDGSVEAQAIDVPLDNPTIEEAKRKKLDLRKRAAGRATDIIMLGREIRVAALVTSLGSYHADHRVTLSGSDLFSDPDSDPLTIIEDMLATCWVRPNQLTFGQPAWTAFRKHPKIVKSFHGNSGDEGRASLKQAAELLEVKRILVGDSQINIKKPGENPVLHRVWGNSVSGQYINRSADTTGGLTFGFSPVYGKKVAGTLKANMGLRGGILVRSGEEISEYIIAQRAGFLIDNAA